MAADTRHDAADDGGHNAADEAAAALRTALDATLARATAPVAGSPKRIAIAYSGGADSTALLQVAASMQRAAVLEVFAFHVHHGLATTADAWLDHCRAEAARLHVGFDFERITITRRSASIEGEARSLRYAALARLCRRHRCMVLMTAHHADDQAETVLVNLARGTGVGGLAAAARSRRLDDDLLLMRPLLDLPGAVLRAHVAALGLRHVEDPSNQDRRFTRNAIRHEVMPALRRIAPAIATRIAQTASHAATLQSLLDDIGREDLRGASSDPSPRNAQDLDVERLTQLSDARAANALRVWLAGRGLRAPSAAALAEMLDQLLHASPSAQIALLHERRTLRLYRGRVSIDAGGGKGTGFRTLRWHGEARIDVPEWNGVLHFTAGQEPGFDPVSLRAGPLVVRARRGGERMRMRADGPSRTLKNLYQEAGIAAWQRPRLPLVYLGERLLFAAGLGANAATVTEAPAGGETIRLHWQATR